MPVSLTQSNWFTGTLLPAGRTIAAYIHLLGSFLWRASAKLTTVAWDVARAMWLQFIDVFWSVITARRRTAFVDLAEQFDLLFDEDGRQLLDEWFLRFPIFQIGNGGTVRYVLRGEFMNARVRIFDYRPRAAGCHWQTVVAF